MMKQLEETVKNSQGYLEYDPMLQAGDSYIQFTWHGMIYGYDYRTRKYELYNGTVSWNIDTPN